MSIVESGRNKGGDFLGREERGEETSHVTCLVKRKGRARQILNCSISLIKKCVCSKH